MNSRRWLLITLLSIAALVGVNLLLSYELDVYGIMRDPRGRKLATSSFYLPMTDDRVFKYMLNQRYVPSNFDGVLIGSSSSGNWDTDLIHGFHIYNESLVGGSASEEKILVDQLPPTAHFRIAICALSPFIVSKHDLKHGLGQLTRREAFGSLNSFGEETAKVLADLRHQQNTFFPNGSRVFPNEGTIKRDDHEELGTHYFDIDMQAMADYRSLIRTLQAHGAEIIYVAPPIYLPIHGDLTQFDRSLERIQTQLPPGPLINFTDPEYTAFNTDSSNFSDGLHVNSQGATKISKILNEKLHLLLGGSEFSP
jgi:hypothetical protein